MEVAKVWRYVLLPDFCKMKQRVKKTNKCIERIIIFIPQLQIHTINIFGITLTAIDVVIWM